MKFLGYALLALLMAFTMPLAGAISPHTENEHMRIYSVEGDFELYRETLEMAIIDRGIVINNVAHIAPMLERTAADVGGEPLYLHGEALEFCSAQLSRDMMQAAIHHIVFCPYVVAVYETHAEPGVIHIGYRRPPLLGSPEAQQALAAVDALLDEIVREALSF